MNRRVALWVLLAGCVDEAQCERRVNAAHRDALRDAAACHFNPEGLPEPECGNLDRRPLFTYYGVWCSSAPLGCIRADAEAERICFGEPSEDDVAPEEG